MTGLIDPSEVLSLSEAESAALYGQIEDIIESMDDKGINEMLQMSGNDFDNLLKVLVEETDNVINLHRYKDSVPVLADGSLPAIKAGYEDYLRKKSLLYFVSSVLPEYELAWHCIEWLSMIQLYRFLCVICSRDHCFGKDTPILMADGSIKAIQDICIGDEVMGPDSNPRKVLNVHKGVDNLYKIDQTRGDSYVVNSNHILALYKTRRSRGSQSRIGKMKQYAWYSEIPWLEDQFIQDFIKRTPCMNDKYRGYKVSIDYPSKKVDLDPYYLGLWLGDGQNNNQGIATVDEEIVRFLESYAKSLGLKLRVRSQKSETKCKSYFICKELGEKGHPIMKALRKYNLLHNKHIPKEYLVNSRDVRLKVLAGLIDSDGGIRYNICYYSTIYKQLAEDIKRLADGLGFRVRLEKRNNYVKFLNRNYESYQLTISGLLDEVPVLLERKKIRFNGKGNSYEKPVSLSGYNVTILSKLKITPFGEGEYYGFEVDKDHRFCLGDSTVVHNSKSYTFSFAQILWRLYRYEKPSETYIPPADIKYYREGMLITNEFKLAKKLLKKVKEEIKLNPILNKRLYPEGRNATWANESIQCTNGAEVTLSSFRTSNRGPHPGWIVVDDFLDKSAMYSKDQREKFKEVFNAEIMNMILPQGQVCVVGTPFHEKDLYHDLKEDPSWAVFEYPALFPDGSVLWDNRYDFESLKKKRTTLGPLIFSREILVRPVSDSTTIFPWSVLERAFVGTATIIMAPNRASFPIKMKKVAIGVDWALSANVGADDSWFVVLGEDYADQMWLMWFEVLHGARYNAQISKLRALNIAFDADVIVAETNVFQKVMADLAKDAGITNIVEEVTGNNKKDIYEGLPALVILFDQYKYKFPRGDARSVEKTNLLCSQLNSIAFDDDKGTLESVSEHDDGCMALYFATKGIKSINGVFRVSTT